MLHTKIEGAFRVELSVWSSSYLKVVLKGICLMYLLPATSKQNTVLHVKNNSVKYMFSRLGS